MTILNFILNYLKFYAVLLDYQICLDKQDIVAKLLNYGEYEMTKAETTDVDYKQRMYEETLARQERLQAERERVDANSFPLENLELKSLLLSVLKVRTLPRGSKWVSLTTTLALI